MRDVTSVNRTGQATERVEEILAATPGVASVSSVVGFSFLDGLAKSSSAFAIVVLDPFAERTDPSLSAGELLARLRGEFRSIAEATVLAFNPPPTICTGHGSGFDNTLNAIRGGQGAEHAATT